jgi:hypothetical protein
MFGSPGFWAPSDNEEPQGVAVSSVPLLRLDGVEAVKIMGNAN